LKIVLIESGNIICMNFGN